MFFFFDKRLLPDFRRNIFQLSGIDEFPFQSFTTFSKQIVATIFLNGSCDIFEPHQRFELWTPGLQDQCSNHWANEATCFWFEIHNINLLTIINCLMLTSISLKKFFKKLASIHTSQYRKNSLHFQTCYNTIYKNLYLPTFILIASSENWTLDPWFTYATSALYPELMRRPAGEIF